MAGRCAVAAVMHPLVREDGLAALAQLDVGALRQARVLITGANGLLGGFLFQLLALANASCGCSCTVYGVSLREPRPHLRSLLSDRRMHFVQADLAAPWSFAEHVDLIFHAAGYAQPQLFLGDKLRTIDLNVSATRRLLDIARRDRARYVCFSSVEVYGDIPPEAGPVPESYAGAASPIGPRAAYGEAKRLAETLCAVYREDFGVDARIVRIAHTYGPGIGLSDRRVVGDFLRMALVDGAIRLRDSGAAVKAFGYVRDIASMILRVALAGRAFVYNVAGRDIVTIRRLAEEIARWAGGVPVILPDTASHEQHIGTDARYVALDISRFEHEFGPVTFVPFSEGIRRTVAWSQDAMARGGGGALS